MHGRRLPSPSSSWPRRTIPLGQAPVMRSGLRDCRESSGFGVGGRLPGAFRLWHLQPHRPDRERPVARCGIVLATRCRATPLQENSSAIEKSAARLRTRRRGNSGHKGRSGYRAGRALSADALCWVPGIRARTGSDRTARARPRSPDPRHLRRMLSSRRLRAADVRQFSVSCFANQLCALHKFT